MDIVKFKITPKTIKIEVRNTNNYVFDFNKAVEINKVDRDILLKLHNALNILFKEEDNRHFSIAKWLEKIAKNPTIDRTKNKKTPKVDEDEAKKVASAGW